MTRNPTKASAPACAPDPQGGPSMLSAEQVALLVEESSLGTAGARQLRDRTTPRTNEVIKARAYITRIDPDWWHNHRHDAEALVAKAEEVAPDRWEVALTLLRLAGQLGHREAATAIKNEDRSRNAAVVAFELKTPRHQSPCEFAEFHREHMVRLTNVLRGETGLPAQDSHRAMVYAMTWAFDEWNELRSSERPEDLVLGRALQYCRRPEGVRPPHLNETSTSTRIAGLRMTGALAVAAAPVRAKVRADTATEQREANLAVTMLYASHYRSLVRLAAMLVSDVGTAEEVVQDAFVAMHDGWRCLRDSDKALSYLRQAVVNRCRSVLRRRAVVERYAPPSRPAPSDPAASVIGELERSAVITALHRLPARQREALVLRYYADLSNDEIASAMGISSRTVRAHVRKGMAALRTVLERFEDGVAISPSAPQQA